MGKLGREDDAYHATCLIMIEYADALAIPADSGEDPEDPLIAAGLEPDSDLGAEIAQIPRSEVDHALASLPSVILRHDAVPDELSPGVFLASMVNRVLSATPVNMHKSARAVRRAARAETDLSSENPF